MFYLKGDTSAAVLTARQHLSSSHKPVHVFQLPPKAMIFCLGSGIAHLKAQYQTVQLMKKLPTFLGGDEVLQILGHEDICFVHGGHGAPMIADVVETLVALGVKQLLLVGLCGVFSQDLNVGDVMIPTAIKKEEGTSYHYVPHDEFVSQHPEFISRATTWLQSDFKVTRTKTVTTDAIYRETFAKEAYWRTLGCYAVEMEASAFLTVANTLNVPSGVILLASDKHPEHEGDLVWSFGNEHFKSTRHLFLQSVITSYLDGQL